MSNFIMILGLLWPNLNTDKTQANVKAQPTGIRLLGRVSEGMSKEKLVQAWGQPSHFAKSFNSYAGIDEVRYYYEDGPCSTSFQSCLVVFQNGTAHSFFNVKGELVE